MDIKKLSRRGFLKGLAATGAAVSLPPLFASRATAAGKAFDPAAFEVFQNACPRNCYDTCAIRSYVRDGILKFVEGAPQSTFTKGSLCVKGYEYPRRVYSPDRIKYPMIQDGRGSGNWRRISWDEAMDRIPDKILDSKKRDGSLLGLGLTKYSGNFGITNYSVEGMMSSLGYTTRFVGTPCWPAGIDAQNYDMGDMWCNDPEDLVKARYIILFGANPAWCSMHTVKFLYEAQRRGAKLVVVDPLFTQTAAKADVYWRPNPGSDGALALGMCRHLLDKNLVNEEFVREYSHGYDEFENYLKNNVTVEWAAEISGIPAEQIRQVTEEFAASTPATVWIGYGLQRHTNGGAMVRSIDAFAAMSGNIGLEGGGARYGQLQTWGFSYYGMIQKQPPGSVGFRGTGGPKGEFDFQLEGSSEYGDRSVNINKTAQEILDTKDPEIKMLWVACKNPFAQDFDRNKMEKAFKKLELIVTVDQFFNETVQHSDIALPVTTLFEEWTVNVSYWHYWLALNEQAIKPMHEAKSDIEIACALSRAMNAKEKGSCTFPEEADVKEWTIKEFNKGIYDYFGISGWEELRNGPVKAKLKSSAAWPDRKFKTPSGKYEFKSELCEKNGFNALPVYVPPREPTAPFRLYTTHIQYGLHSQFVNLDWMRPFYSEPFVFIHPATAKEKGIEEGDRTIVSNSIGEVEVRAKLSDNVARDMLVMYEAWFPYLKYNVQNVVDDCRSDMGAMKTGAPGAAILDQFVDIRKVG
ncbi:MAG: molybdopterin-dependent oxidoreductase [Desulfovibrio sp.]|nr:molybdopterin-dependent oxidoreductase [Desulfovibrio sp.]